MKKKIAAALDPDEQPLSADEMVELAKHLLALTPPPPFLSSSPTPLQQILDGSALRVLEERLLSVVDELVAANYAGGVVRSPAVGFGLVLSLLALSNRDEIIFSYDKFSDDFRFRGARKEEALKAFYIALQSNSQVRRLTLRGLAFETQEAAAQLAHYLNVTSTLQHLEFFFCDLFDEAVVWGAFSDALQSNSSLHSLSIADEGRCGLGAHMVATFNRFSGLSHIILRFSNNDLSLGVRELLLGWLSPGNCPTLTRLDVDFSNILILKYGIELMGKMVDALLHNTTLTRLRVKGNIGSMDNPGVKHSMGFMDDHFLWPESVCAKFAAMLRANCTLKVLEFLYLNRRFNEDVAHALSQNRSLESVAIRLDEHGATYLFRHLSDSDSSGGPNGGPLTLHTLRLAETCGDAEALAHMLATNKTLQVLDLSEAYYTEMAWSHHILPALLSNTTLQTLDLWKCQGVGGQLVYNALMDLLRTNTAIQKINLYSTPLARAGKDEAVKEALRRNVEYRAALKKHVPTIPPKSCRLVLCGYSYAGKTTLVETLQKSLHQHDATMKNQCGTKEEEKPRTRGCDIATLLDEASLRICAWDFAGHQHYYALHDCIFPTVSNGTSVFLFAFNPLDHFNGSRKRDVMFQQELEFWLRFIASNSHELEPGVKPIVIVVVTHQDQQEAKMHKFQVGLIVRKLAQTFERVVHVHKDPFLVDAFSQDHIKEIWDTLELLFRKLVQQLPQVPIICEQFRMDMEKWASQNGRSPVITSNESRALFQKINVDMLHCQEDTPYGTSVRVSAFIAQEESWNVVMAYLHDVGAVLYSEDLDFVVINPHWFAHGILGYLVNPSFSTSLQPDYEPPFRPQNGLIDIIALQQLLEESLGQMGLDTSLLTIERFIQLLLRMNLCYEQVHTDGGGTTYHNFFIPSLLSEDTGDHHIGHEGVSPWTPMANEKESCRFVGHRLQCQDTTCTFFTPGFFPRLQVEMYNWCLDKGWITQDQMDTTHFLRANVFEISIHGHDLKLEHSGDAGYFVDILVRSFKSYSKAIDFVQNQVIARIRRFCASGKGCVGVTLEEHLIRRECVQTLTLCKYRKKQSILWADLRGHICNNDEKRIYMQHWNAVTHENQGSPLILNANMEYAALHKDDNNQNDIIILGESVPDVLRSLGIPSWIVEDEDCYPNTNGQKGKRRGLALVISMEAKRPGEAVDRDRLESFAKSAHFDLELWVDSTAAEIRAHVKQLAQNAALKEDDCFLCCVNGHGGTMDGKQVVQDKNEDIIFLVRDIFQPFQQSMHLVGKPKVFFINSCRGNLKHLGSPLEEQEVVAEGEDKDVPISNETIVEQEETVVEQEETVVAEGEDKDVPTSNETIVEQEETVVAEGEDKDVPISNETIVEQEETVVEQEETVVEEEETMIEEEETMIEEEAVEHPFGETECLTFLEHLTDWLIVLSTTENSVNWRKRIKGTMFVKALTEGLVTHCQTSDVVSILDKVNKQLTGDIAKEPDSSGTLNTYRQSMVVQHTLTRKIYWGHVV